uniref:F-box domain-containing protein n=1 Tax=Kalanchoe fedtschenkoi TaxID=63787 RepID=A0A7N0RF30_KALFE
MMITDKSKKIPKGMKHKTAAVSSAEPELCGDLIREILIKLPVKSLLRFKQVSKTWLHMITSNDFIYSHYSVAQNRQSGPSFFVVRHAVGSSRISSLIRTCIFFGHVEYKDDDFSYKVGIFSARRQKSVGVHRLHLYSSSSNSWKVILTPQESVVRCWMGDGVNLNGKYHILWMEKKEEDYHIMTFDYSIEVFGRIEVPDLPQTNRRRNLMYKSFLTLDDDTLLRLVITWKNEEVDHEEFLDLWTMRKYGAKESWSKDYTVGPISHNMRVVGYLKSAGGFLLKDFHNELYLYNCVSFAVERIPLHVAFDYGINLRLYERTTESLVPIKGTQTQT